MVVGCVVVVGSIDVVLNGTELVVGDTDVVVDGTVLVDVPG